MPIVAAELQAKVGVAGAQQAASELKQTGAAFDQMAGQAKAAAGGLQSAETAVKSAGAGFSSGAKSVLMFGGAAGVGAAATTALLGGLQSLMRGAIGLAGGLLQAHASMEQTEVAFKQLTGSAAQAEKLLSQLRDLAASTPFEFPELAKNARLLLAFGDTAKDIVPHLTAIGDAVSALGGGSAEIDRVVRAIGQMESKGRILAEEMNQLSEIGINGFALLAQETGKSEAELRKMGETGQLLATEYIPLLYQGLERTFGGGMAAQAQTFNGLWSTLKDNILQAGMAISQPFFEKAKAGLQRLVEYTQTAEFDKKMDEWAESAADLAEGLGTFVSETGPKLIATIQDLNTALQPLAITFTAVGSASVDSLGPLADMVDLFNQFDDALHGLPMDVLSGLIEFGASAVFKGNVVYQTVAQGLGAVTTAANLASDAFGLLSDDTDDYAEALAFLQASQTPAAAAAADYREELLEQRAAIDEVVASQINMAQGIGPIVEQHREMARLINESTQAMTRQAELIQQQGRDAQITAEAMRAYTHEQSQAAFYTDKLREAQDALSVAYQTGLKIQSDYTAQGSEFSSQASNIEKALEIVNKRVADGTATTEDYAFILKYGDEALGRFKGGMEDAAITAGEYAIKNGLLMEVQDKINQQYPDLIVGSEEYKQKLNEAALAAGLTQEEFDEMTGPGEGVEGALTGLKDAIAGPDGLIAAINNLPTEITVTVQTAVERENFDWLWEDLKLFDGSVFTANATVGFTASGGGDTYTPPSYVPPDMGGSGPQARGVPEMSLQGIKAQVAAAQAYTDLLDDLVGYIQTAAERMGDGVDAAQEYASLAGDTVRVFLDGAKLLAQLNEQPLTYTQQAAESVAAIKFMLEHAVTSLSDSAALMSTEAIEHAHTFADAADATAGAMLAGLELLVSLGEQSVTYGAEQERAIADLKFALEKAVISLSDAANLMDMDGVEAAKQLADASGAILGALSDTMGFLADLTEYAGTSQLSARELGALAHQLADDTRTIADAFLLAAEGWDTEITPAVESFADAAGASLDVMSAVPDALEAILSFGSMENKPDVAGLAEQMLADVDLIVQALETANALWQERGAPSIEDYADGAGAAVGLMADVAEAYEAIAGASAISKEQMELFYTNFVGVLDLLGRMAAAVAPYEAIAASFAQAAQNIADSMKAAADAIAEAAGAGAATLAGVDAAITGGLSGLGDLSDSPSLGSVDRGGVSKGSGLDAPIEAYGGLVADTKALADTVIVAAREVGDLSDSQASGMSDSEIARARAEQDAHWSGGYVFDSASDYQKTLLSSGLYGFTSSPDRDIVFEMNGNEWGRLTGYELMRGKSMRRKLGPC